jgi:hypothetical protein
VVKNASAKKPPRRARRKAVPMKLVTLLAELDGEKCMNFDMYSTRLLALARNARFSKISTTKVCITTKLPILVSVICHDVYFIIQFTFICYHKEKNCYLHTKFRMLLSKPSYNIIIATSKHLKGM